MGILICILYHYISCEDTHILLDESHVSKMLATCVSVGFLTAVTIRRNDTHCQGTVNCKPAVSWFPLLLRTSCLQDPQARRKYVKAWAECRRQQWNCPIVENNDKENNIVAFMSA